MTSNRWFEVYITDGLDKYYEKSTIPRIYILTLKVRGSPSRHRRKIYTPSLTHQTEFGLKSLKKIVNLNFEFKDAI